MLEFLFFNVEIKLFIFFTSGTFKPKQLLDVIGHVADNQNPTISHLQVIHTYPILFCGSSDPIPVDRKARFNPGEKLIKDFHIIKLRFHMYWSYQLLELNSQLQRSRIQIYLFDYAVICYVTEPFLYSEMVWHNH